MAQQFRIVRCDMWRKDDWFAELAPDAKLVWIYTFTNDSTSPAGIYRIALRTIANDTGIPITRVREIIAEFQEAGKLEYEGDTIWPITMRKHQIGPLSPADNLLKRINKDVAELPQTGIVARYKAFYTQPEAPSDPLQTPSEGGSNPLPRDKRQETGDIDTGYVDTREKEDDRETESSSSFAAQMAAFHNTIGFVSGKAQADEITDMLDELAGQNLIDWWDMALKVAADNNKQSWAYVRSTLRNCLREGHPPGPKVGPNGKKPSTPPDKYRMIEVPGPDGKPMMKREALA